MKKPKPTKATGSLTRSSGKNRSHILGDRTIITQEDYASADLELHAFFRFNRLIYDSFKMTTGVVSVPLKILLKPQPATTKQWLDLVALRIATDELNQNALLPLDAKRDLNPEESFYAQQKREAFLQIRFDRHKAALRECLACLAKRKTGWTLLPFKSKHSLVDIVTKCFSPHDASWLRNNGTILGHNLIQLVARKNILQRGKRTRGANSRTKTERAEAAKRGWKSRKSAVKPTP